MVQHVLHERAMSAASVSAGDAASQRSKQAAMPLDPRSMMRARCS